MATPAATNGRRGGGRLASVNSIRKVLGKLPISIFEVIVIVLITDSEL